MEQENIWPNLVVSGARGVDSTVRYADLGGPIVIMHPRRGAMQWQP